MSSDICINPIHVEGGAFWAPLLGNSTQERVFMVPVTLTQDPHGSFKVSYPTTRIIIMIWSRVSISTKRSTFSGGCYQGKWRFWIIWLLRDPACLYVTFQNCILLSQLGKKLEGGH